MNQRAEHLPTAAADQPVPPWMLAAAEDLLALAWLHEAERSPEMLTRVRQAGFPSGLILVRRYEAISREISEVLDAICLAEDPARLADELAAEYAAIYLTHALRASPCESVWLDEDHLMLQGPTFAVRECYRAHGFAWVRQGERGLSEDHISHELAFVAHLLSRGLGREALKFMNEHLLLWLPRFVERVAQRAETRFYVALAQLTGAAVESVYDSLQ